MLPPETLAVVVMAKVEFNADTTFDVKLNPAAFKLPPVILPVDEIKPPVILPVAEIKPPVSKLPVVVLPVTLNVANVPTPVAVTPVN
jgi:hypothetical protein